MLTEPPNTTQRKKEGLFIPVFILVLISLGGGTVLWAQALTLAVVGFFLIFSPPYTSPNKGVEIAIALLVLSGLLSFIPESILPSSYWRLMAVDQFKLQLSPTHSPQALISLENFILMLGGIAWFYLCTHQRITHDNRVQLLWIFVIIASILAIGVIIGNVYHIKHPLGTEATNFSYFPNRNQSSNFFCLSALAASCLLIRELKYRKKLRYILLSFIFTGVLFVALVYSLSRAGVFLFFLGIILWSILNTELVSKQYFFKFILPILVICLSLFVLTKGDTLQRVTELIQGKDESPVAFRLQVYSDTWALLKDYSLFGLGLGQFQYFFPFYRDKTYIYGNLIHPESDWLWVWSEMGILGLLSLFILAASLFYSIKSFKSPIVKPYKTIALVCLILFFIHSLIDVPGHRYGTVFTVIFLYTLAHSSSLNVPSLIPQWGFRFLGLFLLAVGCLWGIGFIKDYPVHSSIVKKSAKNTLLETFNSSNDNQFLATFNQAVRWIPLNYEWYYKRALFNITKRQNLDQVLLDFRRARFLEPIDSRIALYEGYMWLNVSPSLAFAAFQEALSRKNFDLEETAGTIVGYTQSSPIFQDYLEALSNNNPILKGRWLLSLHGAQFDEQLKTVLKRNIDFSQLRPNTQHTLFEKWAKSNSHEILNTYLDNHQQIPNIFYYKALIEAHKGNHKEAAALMLEYLPATEIPIFESNAMLSKEELRKRLLQDSGNIVNGLGLFKKQLDDNEYEAAIKTLETLSSRSSNSGIYVDYWLGVLYEKTGRHVDSLNAFTRYFEHIR